MVPKLTAYRNHHKGFLNFKSKNLQQLGAKQYPAIGIFVFFYEKIFLNA